MEFATLSLLIGKASQWPQSATNIIIRRQRPLTSTERCASFSEELQYEEKLQELPKYSHGIR
jgi:hypothetical protein